MEVWSGRGRKRGAAHGACRDARGAVLGGAGGGDVVGGGGRVQPGEERFSKINSAQVSLPSHRHRKKACRRLVSLPSHRHRKKACRISSAQESLPAACTGKPAISIIGTGKPAGGIIGTGKPAGGYHREAA